MKIVTKYKKPKDLEILIESYLGNRHRNIVLNSGTIIHYSYDIKEKTDAAHCYFDIIRRMSFLFRVKVLRNPHNIEEGLAIVGKQRIVESFVHYLDKVFEYAESNVQFTQGFNRVNRRDKNESDRRILSAKRVLQYLDKIRRVGIFKTQYGITDSDYLMETERLYEILYVQYIDETPSLTIKKAYSWRTDYGTTC
jgi:hypothetical protein